MAGGQVQLKDKPTVASLADADFITVVLAGGQVRRVSKPNLRSILGALAGATVADNTSSGLLALDINTLLDGEQRPCLSPPTSYTWFASMTPATASTLNGALEPSNKTSPGVANGYWVPEQGASGSTANKAPCKCGAEGNVNLSVPGISVFDTISVTAGNRVLISLQSDQTENGIYIFDTISTPMVRAGDADTGTELEGAMVLVQQGPNFGNKLWKQDADSITLGSTNITWSEVAGGLPTGNRQDVTATVTTPATHTLNMASPELVDVINLDTVAADVVITAFSNGEPGKTKSIEFTGSQDVTFDVTLSNVFIEYVHVIGEKNILTVKCVEPGTNTYEGGWMNRTRIENSIPPGVAIQPTGEVTGVGFSNITTSSFDVSFTRGTGSNWTMVVRKDGAAVDYAGPTDNQSYAIGENLGSSNFVAYMGPAEAFSMSAIPADTTRHFAFYPIKVTTTQKNYRVVTPTTASQAVTAGGLSAVVIDAHFGNVDTGVSPLNGDSLAKDSSPNGYDTMGKTSQKSTALLTIQGIRSVGDSMAIRLDETDNNDINPFAVTSGVDMYCLEVAAGGAVDGKYSDGTTLTTPFNNFFTGLAAGNIVQMRRDGSNNVIAEVSTDGGSTFPTSVTFAVTFVGDLFPKICINETTGLFSDLKIGGNLANRV